VGKKIFNTCGELEILLCARRGGLIQKTAWNCRLLAEKDVIFLYRENFVCAGIFIIFDITKLASVMLHDELQQASPKHTHMQWSFTDLIYLCKNHILYKRAIVLF